MRMIKFCLALSMLAQYPGLFSLCLLLRKLPGLRKGYQEEADVTNLVLTLGCCVTLDRLLNFTYHIVFTC